MDEIKAARTDGQHNPHVDYTHNVPGDQDFLDPEVKPDGKRLESKTEVTPELIGRIIKERSGTLDPLHFKILRNESSISPEIVVQREYRSITSDKLSILRRLGFSEKHGPGLLIPVRGLDGEIVSCQVRFDSPVLHIDPKTGKRKKLRYLGPPGMDLRIDFPQRPMEEGEAVWIVEGMKKADALRSRGIYAIAIIGVWGALGRQARKDLNTIEWAGREVIVCFDSDVASNPNVKKAEGATVRLFGELGAGVQMARLPEAADGAKVGVDDFLSQGGTLDELRGLIEEPEPALMQDELGIAESLDDGSNLIFAQSRFWAFSGAGGIWAEAPDETIKRSIQEACRENHLEVKDSFVRGSFNCAKARFFRHVQFDQIDKRSVGVANGVLRYVDGGWSLAPYQRENYRRIKLPAIYDQRAQCPRFEQFLSEVFDGTPDKKERALAVLEFLGLSMTALTEYEKALLLVGKGGNGKSVLLRVLEALVGAKNRSSVQLKQLENRFQRAHLDGRLVNIMSELSEGGEIPDAEIKAIISGEPITAEHKLKPPFEFFPVCKLWIATNHMPSVRDLSDGLFRRFIILSFPNRFDDKPSRDTRLSEKLAAEASGILNYCLKALAGVYERGALTEPTSSREAVQGWKRDSDQVSQFLDDEMVVELGASISSGEAYSLYTQWAKESGIRRLLGRKSFTERLVNHGIEPAKGTGGVRLLWGLRGR